MKNLQQCQTIINQWQQDYQQLHDILNDEQLSLEKREFEQLKKTTQEKNSMVHHINKHELPLLMDLKGIQINSLNQFKQHCNDNPELKKSWEALMNVVGMCSFKNEVNARLIQLLHQSSRRTLNLIKGFDPDNNIYNASGNRTAVRHSSDTISA